MEKTSVSFRDPKEPPFGSSPREEVGRQGPTGDPRQYKDRQPRIPLKHPFREPPNASFRRRGCSAGLVLHVRSMERTFAAFGSKEHRPSRKAAAPGRSPPPRVPLTEGRWILVSIDVPISDRSETRLPIGWEIQIPFGMERGRDHGMGFMRQRLGFVSDRSGNVARAHVSSNSVQKEDHAGTRSVRPRREWNAYGRIDAREEVASWTVFVPGKRVGMERSETCADGSAGSCCEGV